MPCRKQTHPKYIPIRMIATADLHDGLLHSANQRLVLAAFAPKDLLFHHWDVHNMKMVVVHIFSQGIGHGPVPLVGMHYSGENVLLTAYDFYSGFVSIGIELFCKFIAAVIVEVSGVHIKDQLTVELGIVLQTSGENHTFGFHLLKHFCITACGCFEMDIVREPLRYDVRVGIGFLFPLIMLLGIGDFRSGQICVSGYGTVNAVISCH